MESLNLIFADPSMQITMIMAIGALATAVVALLFTKLKDIAGKTETTLDDEIVAHLEKLAKKTVKSTVKNMTAKAEAKKKKPVAKKKK